MSPRRCFTWLVIAGIVSSVGTGLTTFTLAVEAFRRSGEATAVGALAAAGLLPMIVVTPLGGVLADRWDRRLAMLLGDGGSGLALLLVVWRLADPASTWPELAASLALSSAFAGLTEPALRATVSDLVTPDELDKASGLLGLTQASRWLIAPALAGVLLLVLPPWAIVAADAATFLCTLAATLATLGTLGVRRPQNHSSAWADFMAGVSACRTPAVAHLIGVMAVATFAAGAVQALMSPLVLPLASATALGVVTSIGASGMLVGSLAIGMVGVRIDLRRGLALGLALSGAALAMIGLRPNLLWITVATCAFFVTLPLANASAEVLLRSSVPNEQLGRVWGIVGITTQEGAVLAFVTLPGLADAALTPALLPGGALAGSLGVLIGTGPGRGVGFALCVAGGVLMVAAGAALASRPLAQAARRAAQATQEKKVLA